MSKLRKSAKGMECQIRMVGICNRNPETVVLCHKNGGGMGAKQPDLFGAVGCSDCHAEYDRRTRKFDKTHADISFYEGMIRTQIIWLREGFIKIL